MTRTILTALACALALGACGSSATPGASASKDDSGLKFARCMRAHGVSNFPDPTPGHGIQLSITPDSGINPRSPAFQSAQRSCQKLLPIKGTPGHVSAGDRRTALRFAECMRTHGEPDFPDPSAASSRNHGPIVALGGMAFGVGPGLDPRSPKFRQAAEHCGIKLPMGPPQSAP